MLSNFGAGTVSKAPRVSGVLVAGGTLNCASCQIQGNDFGIGALSVTVPVSTAYPSASPSAYPSSTPTGEPSSPSVTLTHSNGDSTIAAKAVDFSRMEALTCRFRGKRSSAVSMRLKIRCSRSFTCQCPELLTLAAALQTRLAATSSLGRASLRFRSFAATKRSAHWTIPGIHRSRGPTQTANIRKWLSSGRAPRKERHHSRQCPRIDGDRRTRSRADANALGRSLRSRQARHNPLSPARNPRFDARHASKNLQREGRVARARAGTRTLRRSSRSRVGPDWRAARASWPRCNAHQAVRSSQRSSAHRRRPA